MRGYIDTLQKSFSLMINFSINSMRWKFMSYFLMLLEIFFYGLTIKLSPNLNSTVIFNGPLADENHCHLKPTTISNWLGHRKTVTKGGDRHHPLHYSLTRKSYFAAKQKGDSELRLRHP